MDQGRKNDTDNLPEKHSEELIAITTLGRKLHERFSVEGVMESAFEVIHKTLAPDRIFSYMQNKGKLELKGISPGGLNDGTDTTPGQQADCRLCRLAADTNKVVFSTPIPAELKCTCELCAQGGYASLAALPLVARKKSIGVLAIASTSPRDYKARRPFLEAIAYQIAVSINNVLSLQKANAKIADLEFRHERQLQEETAGKRPEPERQHAGDILQAFFDSTPDPMMLLDKEKHIERQLRHADKMISLGVLVSGVAHEINNPNNWTMMNAPILVEAWKDIRPILDAYYDENGDFKAGGLPYNQMREAVPRLLAGILDGSKRIMRIVEELKNYSRHEPDKNRTPVDINESLKSAVSLVSKQVEKSTDNFSVSYGEKIPPIYGNSQKIEQVAVNLILNACQALPDKSRGISLRSFFDNHSEKVVISVHDEGLGIPENVIPRIMDPFFTTKRHMGGTGLGLSVSTKIVQDLGGLLTVKSKPGKGATFTVQLPTEQRIDKTKVLVADDDETVRDFVAGSLRRTQRFFVQEAATGIETCLMLGMAPPDVLILDINMPDMDGLEVCRQIQKMPSLSELKVVIITGDRQSDKARSMAEMGFGNILAKPLSVEDITGIVETVVRDEEIVSEKDHSQYGIPE